MNRLMKSALMMTLTLMLALPLAVMAEEPFTCPEGGPGMRGPGPHHGLMGRLGDELGLTDEQKEEIRAIVAEEMPATRQRIEERVNGLLTPEQQVKLEQLKEEQPGMMRKGKGRGMRGPGGHPGARLERMAETLDLTDEQQTTIRQIFDDAAPPKRLEIREQINSVLTPEQQEKMEELHEARRSRMEERRGF